MLERKYKLLKMETISRNKRKANKIHSCNWCGCNIIKGEIYSHSVNKDEGEIYVWKNHFRCSQIVDIIGMWDDGHGIDMEGFQESIKMHYDHLLITHYSILTESEEIKKHNFEGKLNFVFKHYNISHC